jgi:hypothetical protein
MEKNRKKIFFALPTGQVFSAVQFDIGINSIGSRGFKNKEGLGDMD